MSIGGDTIYTLAGITRVEVINHIDGKGRVFSHITPAEFNVSVSSQDGGKTLKIFIGGAHDR